MDDSPSFLPPTSGVMVVGPEDHLAKLLNPARLAALVSCGLMDSAADAAFDRFTRLVAKWLDVPTALVSLVDDHRQFFKSALGLSEPWASRRETPLTHSFCQYGVTTAEPLIVMDAREHPWLRENLAVTELGVIAYAGVPLVTTDQEVLGMLCAIDVKPREWSEEDVSVLRELASMVGTELELRARVRALKVAQATSDENRTLLRSVLDCMDDAVVVRSHEGQVALRNAAADREWREQLAEGKAKAQFFEADGTTPIPFEETPSMRALRGECVSDLEVLRRIEGKPEQSFRVNSAPILNYEGEIRASVTVMRENTAARLARGALARSVALFRTVVRNLPNGAVLLFDQNLRYLMADGESLLKSIGLTSQSLVGHTLYDVVPAERAELMANYYRRVLAGESLNFDVVRDGFTFTLNLVPVRDERGTITAGMALIYDVTEHKRIEASLRTQAEEIRSLSIRDELSGLYNRRGFLELARHQIKLADRSGRPALLFFVDLNGMKLINDQLGHDEGDRALCETADVLRAAFRASDVIGRLGGDEFVALLPDASEAQIELFSERIQRELADRNDRPDRAFRLSASIGGTAYDPSTPETIEALLAKADALMYEQKRTRGDSRRSPVPHSPPPASQAPAPVRESQAPARG